MRYISPMPARYKIAGEEFNSIAAVEKRIRSIKDTVPINCRLVGQDKDFAIELFSYHPNKGRMLQRPDSVRVVPGNNSSAGDRRFLFQFGILGLEPSYKKALKGLSAASPHGYYRTKALAKMREIADRQANEWECSVRPVGSTFYVADCHRHHKTPFKDLVEDFMRLEGEASFQALMQDKDWLRRWSRYHREHAEFVLLPKEEHVEVHRKE